jgi:hypothetical protein
MNQLEYLQEELCKYEESYGELKQHYYMIQHGTSAECLEEQEEVLNQIANLDMAVDLTVTLINNLLNI